MTVIEHIFTKKCMEQGWHFEKIDPEDGIFANVGNVQKPIKKYAIGISIPDQA